MTPIEWVRDGGQVLAILIPARYAPARTEFITPDSYNQQVGFIVYPPGGAVAPHRHRALERVIRGTGEVLVVRGGRCEVDFYDATGAPLATRTLGPGDVIVLVSGGHGFRMQEHTVLLEIKQGPYPGRSEKEPVGSSQ